MNQSSGTRLFLNGGTVDMLPEGAVGGVVAELASGMVDKHLDLAGEVVVLRSSYEVLEAGGLAVVATRHGRNTETAPLYDGQAIVRVYGPGQWAAVSGRYLNDPHEAEGRDQLALRMGRGGADSA